MKLPFFERSATGKGIDPVRDWLILITLAMIALAAIVIWNLRAFDIIASGGNIGVSPKTGSSLFDRSSLAEIRAIFEKRALESSRYEAGGYQFTDPSQ